MWIREILKKNKRLVLLVNKERLIVNNIKQFLLAQKIKYRIKSDTIVHLMFNDKFIEPYVDFLNQYFDEGKHLFLCKRWFKLPFPQRKNVVEVSSYRLVNLSRAKKIICHSLFDGEVIDYYCANKSLLAKSCCIVWGGDFTDVKELDVNSNFFYVASNFSQYIGSIDEPIIRHMYNISNKIPFLSANYIFPLNKKLLDAVNMKKKNYIQIQLGQSVQPSILQALDYISKFKNENIKVVVILSYGGDGKLENEIIKKGQAIFGNKFSHIDNYMAPDEYANHIGQNDILVLNADHQNAVGNTFAHLYLGKKVFIRSDVPTGDYLKKEYNIQIFSTESIKDLSYNDFVNDIYSVSNSENAKAFFDENRLAKQWEAIFK